MGSFCRGSSQKFCNEYLVGIMCEARGHRRLCKQAEKPLELILSFSTCFRLHMELRSGKLLLHISPESMSAPMAHVSETENLLATPPPQPASLRTLTYYARVQKATGGYLWFYIAAAVLLLACGLLLFPQKMWNRMMMALFGCITFHVRGKAYRFCEQPPAAQGAGDGIPL